MLMLKLTTILFLIAGSVLATTHILAMQFYLYWSFPWIDMPMHYLGGIVVGLLLYTCRDLGVSIIPEQPRWFTVLFFVMAVAFAWEVYEILIGIPMLDNYVSDTIIDLVNGLGYDTVKIRPVPQHETASGVE